MAIATAPIGYSDALPDRSRPVRRTVADGDPGLAARLTSLGDQLASLVSDLDPALLVGADAATLYASFSRIERLVGAGKTLLAVRIAESGHWEAEGHRSPVSLLADLEGGTTGQARRTLVTGQRLAELPSTEEALRRGALSGAKVAEIVGAAATDPDAEGALLAGSEREPLRVVKERCQRVRATSAQRDPVAAERRIHDDRRFRSWTDAEGAFCFEGRDTAERGAHLLAALTPVTDRLREDRRAAAREVAARRTRGAAPPTPESEEALRADAFFLLVTGGRTAAARSHSDGPDDVKETDRPDGAGDLIATTPPATVMVRVDLEALRRGHALPGELSEIDSQGPVPVPTVAGLADDAFLRLVFTEAGDIRAISHLSRTINSHLRTALAFRDRCCVVPGCRAAYSLEIDHVLPLEQGGRTTLDNLALLCRHHHRMKTYDGWVLARDGGTDEAARWTFTPLPPFGQEPDLGLDLPAVGRGTSPGEAPPDPVPRT